MSGFSYYIKEVMQDSTGAYSNKRLITTAAFVFMTIAFFANLFWGFAISQYIFDAMATVVMAGLASNVGENFATAWVTKSNSYNSSNASPPVTPKTNSKPAVPTPAGEG